MKPITGLGSEVALSLARSMSVRANAVIASIVVFRIGVSQAFWTCCMSVEGMVDKDCLNQETSTVTLVASTFVLKRW